MRSRIKFVIGMLVFLGLNCLVLAQDSTPIFTHPTPNIDPFPFPTGLFCADAEAGLGPTWNGIVIGKSSLEDLKTLMMSLSPNYQFTDRGTRGVFFSIFEISEALKKHIPSSLVACIKNGVVVAMSDVVSEDKPSLFLEDLVAELGVPDAVTWDTSSISRVVFWFKEGLAVSVLTVEPYGAIISPVYFPYQLAEGYKDRWPFNRKSQHFFEGDERFNPPLPTEQNPFDFDSIVATITAQPSRTPTPTFAPYTPSPTITP
jgi:hypothetical protein